MKLVDLVRFVVFDMVYPSLPIQIFHFLSLTIISDAVVTAALCVTVDALTLDKINEITNAHTHTPPKIHIFESFCPHIYAWAHITVCLHVSKTEMMRGKDRDGVLMSFHVI